MKFPYLSSLRLFEINLFPLKTLNITGSAFLGMWQFNPVKIVIFLKSSEILQRFILDTQKTVTEQWYIEQYLLRVIEFLKNLRSNLGKNSWPLRNWNCLSTLFIVQTLFLETCIVFSFQNEGKREEVFQWWGLSVGLGKWVC